MKFINRECELQLLESEYAAGRFSFVVVYGRRRVGKTRLIKEFIQGKQAVYFLGDAHPTQAEALCYFCNKCRNLHPRLPC